MSSTAAVEIHGAHAGHHELGFVRTYLFSTDHKMIAKQFLFVALFMMSIGGLMAMLMRLELGWPESQWSFLSIFPQTLAQDNAITPNTYNSMFTMHATIMIFFVVMPILVGTFGNLLVPLMIGARDMAFPMLNMLSFWVSAIAGVIMLSSFFVPGGAAAAGWTSYAPLSAVPNYTGVDWGQNLWCISIIVLGVGSLMGSINYITTIINMRTKGMTFFRLPLVIWSLFITAILLLLALPVLTTALALLLFDRMAGTHFFLPSGGGEPLLWQHLFWFFGHPEVYIMILPAMGITSDILATFSRKPIFGYRAMAYAMIGDRLPVMDRVGPSHVPVGHESGAGNQLHAHHDGHRSAVGDQNLQLARHALQRKHPLHHRDAQCAGVRLDVRHRRSVGNLHGLHAG